MEQINKDGTRRELTNLNVQMIALGGAIGTGLFLGAGQTIQRTGPSILLVYLVVGLFFSVMIRAIGEMMYKDPSQHTFVAFIHQYLGADFGKFAEWSYWMTLILAGMAELIAIATYIRLWLPNVSAWLIEILILGILSIINLSIVRFFGKTESMLSIIKIIAIIALILVGIWMIAVHHKNPVGTSAGLGNVTKDYTAFPHGFREFLNAFPMVFFSFEGMEFIGITTAETKNPRQVLPLAVKQVVFRILIFYIGALFVIMAITPWQQISQSSSPFVQVFQIAGMPAASQIINFVVIVAATSALNSAIFSSGRHLYQLAVESDSKFLSKLRHVSKSGIPSYAVLFSACLMLFGPVLSAFKALSAAFSLVASICGDIYILVCILTMIAHYRYRQSSDFMEDGFRMPAYKILNPLTIAFFSFVFITMFFNKENVIPAVGALIWLIVFLTVVKFRKTKEFPDTIV